MYLLEVGFLSAVMPSEMGLLKLSRCQWIKYDKLPRSYNCFVRLWVAVLALCWHILTLALEMQCWSVWFQLSASERGLVTADDHTAMLLAVGEIEGSRRSSLR